MEKIKLRVKYIIYIIILIMLLLIIFISAVILVDSIINPDEIPSFFGWKPFIVMSDTMDGTINKGDIVLVKECDLSEISENDIISFKNQDDIVITHRVKEIREEEGLKKYITKGDNTNIQDEGYVVDSQIEGRYKFKIDRLGSIVLFIQTPIGILISLGTPILILLIMQYLDVRETKEKQNHKEL